MGCDVWSTDPEHMEDEPVYKQALEMNPVYGICLSNRNDDYNSFERKFFLVYYLALTILINGLLNGELKKDIPAVKYSWEELVTDYPRYLELFLIIPLIISSISFAFQFPVRWVLRKDCTTCNWLMYMLMAAGVAASGFGAYLFYKEMEEEDNVDTNMYFLIVVFEVTYNLLFFNVITNYIFIHIMRCICGKSSVS